MPSKYAKFWPLLDPCSNINSKIYFMAQQLPIKMIILQNTASKFNVHCKT